MQRLGAEPVCAAFARPDRSVDWQRVPARRHLRIASHARTGANCRVHHPTHASLRDHQLHWNAHARRTDILAHWHGFPSSTSSNQFSSLTLPSFASATAAYDYDEPAHFLPVYSFRLSESGVHARHHLVPDDPAVIFMAGSVRSLPFSVTPNNTQISIADQSSTVFQTGTTEGTITFTITANGLQITGNPSTRSTFLPR